MLGYCAVPATLLSLFHLFWVSFLFCFLLYSFLGLAEVAASPPLTISLVFLLDLFRLFHSMSISAVFLVSPLSRSTAPRVEGCLCHVHVGYVFENHLFFFLVSCLSSFNSFLSLFRRSGSPLFSLLVGVAVADSAVAVVVDGAVDDE